jgi:hypothetical protein
MRRVLFSKGKMLTFQLHLAGDILKTALDPQGQAVVVAKVAAVASAIHPQDPMEGDSVAPLTRMRAYPGLRFAKMRNQHTA